jgi:hypothetical protein
MSKKTTKKGGKRCRDWSELRDSHGLTGVLRHTRRGVNIRFDQSFRMIWSDRDKLVFEFMREAEEARWSNPPSKWGKSV